MTVTARFELQRRKELKALFAKGRMIDLWRKLVRQQLRSLDIKDLHDYHDYHKAIDSRVDEIIERIQAGLYRAEAPLIYRTEKKLGVCRHQMVPSPSDAIVFQVLTDELYEKLKKKQPSKNAYYTRARHFLQSPHEFKDIAEYPWFIQWPKFQKEIWGFTASHKYLVTTDIANYYDNIGLRELRHVISSLAETKEVYLDLLFSLIEDLSWSPDYLPKSNKGLPTINIEAPRLLAHALLFEVDDILKSRTKNCFVRWMDDINFGVAERADAHIILGEINDVLKSRGLALNLAKTDVLTPDEAEAHFLVKENKYLDDKQLAARIVAKSGGGSGAKGKLEKDLAASFYAHIKRNQARNKDKVSKRYLTIFRILGSDRVFKKAADLFLDNPGIRSSVLHYLEVIPFSKPNAREVLRILDDLVYLDDIAIYQLVDSVAKWSVPRDKRGGWFVEEMGSRLKAKNTPFGWLCWINFLTKYGEPNEILTAVANMRKFAAKEAFFSRQAMAALTRALAINSKDVLRRWDDEISRGAADSGSVAVSMKGYSQAAFPAKSHNFYKYLFPDKPQRPYPIAKFLILCALAYSDAEKKVSKKRPEVDAYVQDVWFRHWLQQINPDWF